MNEKNITLISQTFGLNTFNKTCYCQLKSLYNTHFTGDNKAECVGVPNMKCLIISLEGTGLIQYWHRSTVTLPAGKIFFGAMKEMRTIKTAGENWHFICYWYYSENFENELDGVFQNEKIDINKELDDAKELISVLQTNTYSNICLASTIFTEKLLRLSELFSANSTASRNTLLDKILAYVNANIKEKITTKDIAREFNYCEKHIRYLFNKNFNVSPGKYIEEVKLSHIIELLNNTALSLAEIAEIYNYSSASHLICNFKKKYGYTPKQYIYRMAVRLRHAKVTDNEDV